MVSPGAIGVVTGLRHSGAANAAATHAGNAAAAKCVNRRRELGSHHIGANMSPAAKILRSATVADSCLGALEGYREATTSWTPAQIMEGITSALRARDMEAVSVLLTMLALQDPGSAQVIYDWIMLAPWRRDG